MTDDNKDLVETLKKLGFEVVEIDEKDGQLIITEVKDGVTTVTIAPGPVVLCDLCNKDYTDSQETGGFLFLSNAVCPTCSPKFMKSVEKEKEERFIRATANEGETFRDFVYRIRK